jgi:basic membrane lipoprotein Med (substrate-binding protein (PBP1-ABC) superfamily)
MFLQFVFSLLIFLSGARLEAKVIKIAYLHDASSAFSERVYSGIDKRVESLEQSHNIFFEYIKTKSTSQLQQSLIKYSRQQFDLIIYAGDDSSGLLQHVAKDYPRVHYLMVDGRSYGPNISSVRFQDADIGFVMGYVAALSNKNRKIVIIAPTERMEVKDVIKPYKKGVDLLSSDIKVDSVFISNEESTWNDSKGMSAVVLKKLKEGYRDFFILAAKGDDEWKKSKKYFSSYKNVSVQIFGRREKIKGVKVSYAYRDYSLLVTKVLQQLEESQWRGGSFDMTVDNGFFKLGPKNSVLGNEKAMGNITSSLKSKISIYRNY